MEKQNIEEADLILPKFKPKQIDKEQVKKLAKEAGKIIERYYDEHPIPQ